MRISDKYIYARAQFNIQKNRQTLAENEERVATGKQINRISDAPEDISRVHEYREKMAKFEAFNQNIDRGNTMLEGSETALAEVTNLLTRIKELVIQGTNGTVSQSGMSGIAKEIEANQDLILGLANTKIDNTYVFGGYKTDLTPFDTSGNFQGDENQIKLEIGEGVYEAINTNGKVTFSGDGTANTVDIFSELNTLVSSLRSGDKNLVRPFLTKVDTMLNQVNEARADIGTKQNKLEISQNILSKIELDTQANLSKLEDADIVTAISQFNQSEKALMASLSSSAKLVDKTLLNYL